MTYFLYYFLYLDVWNKQNNNDFTMNNLDDKKMNNTITLDIYQLSAEIHLAEKTIRSTLVRNPQALPPRLLIPGQKRLLWLRTDVQKWYEKQDKIHGSNPRFSSLPKPTDVRNVGIKKPGRPKKTMKITPKIDS